MINQYKIIVQFFLICLIVLAGQNGFSQSGISGKVTDQETDEGLIAASLEVFQNGVLINAETTDIDGDFMIHLDPGVYELEVYYVGFTKEKISEIEIRAGEFIKVDIELRYSTLDDSCLGCWYDYYKIPLIQQDETSTGLTISSETIEKLPTRNINQIITLTPGVSFTQ